MPIDNAMQSAQPTRLLHTMLRVSDLERSLQFYIEKLGMRMHRQERYPAGRFTLAFLGYGDERTDACIELTHNWDQPAYQHGTAYGHIALAVVNVAESCASLQAAGVQITMAPRSVELKKALYLEIALAIARDTHFKSSDVIINLIESARENWSFGNGIAQFT
jgi:lactoylglutathione lyase